MSIRKNIIRVFGVLFVLLFVVYPIALWRDIKTVDNFCAEMQPGLDVRKIAGIANKYDVGFKNIRDPKSVDNEKLGFKLTDKENTWFFAVGAPMTIGEHACGVYHNNKVVLSTSLGG
jgi:hypothetical protein